MEIRNYGKVEDVIEVQNLVQIQTKAYRDFLQADVPASKKEELWYRNDIKRNIPRE